MHFCAIHLDDASWPPEEEKQVYIVVPGGAKKTAIAVPLDALPQFLPRASRPSAARAATCAVCGAKIPNPWPGSTRDPGDLGKPRNSTA